MGSIPARPQTFVVILGAIFIVNIWKRYLENGGGIILLLGQLVKSKFDELKIPKTSMLMISRFLGPLGTLIYGFEYTKVLLKFQYKIKDHC